MGNAFITMQLSRFITGTVFEDIPEKVIEISKEFILDWIGVTLGAVREESSRILMDVIEEIGGNEQASVLGYGLKTSILNASLVNGTMSHALDFDDAHSKTRNHTSAPILSSLFTFGEYKGVSGAELITAYVIGFEVSNRIGLALGKDYYESGWHATSVLGRFGAVAGLSKLLGLNQSQTANALGLAATQSGGVRTVFGTMGKPFHVGKAAMDGILSVLLSERGFTAPENILDEKESFLEMFSSKSDRRQIIKGLGKEYQMLGNSLKPYAACLLTHPVIYGLICLKSQHNLSSEDVDEIYLEVAPLNFKVTDNKNPRDPLEAKFSLQYCSAIGLAEGKAGESQFSNCFINDAQIIDLMGKVRATVKESFKETEAKIILKSKDGEKYRKHVFAGKGDPKNPLKFDEVIAKFEDLTAGLISEKQQHGIIGMVEDLEDIEDIKAIVKLCHPFEMN